MGYFTQNRTLVILTFAGRGVTKKVYFRGVDPDLALSPGGTRRSPTESWSLRAPGDTGDPGWRTGG